MYAVGLDVGTTFTTVAIWRDGDVSTLPRLERIPSRVLVAPDGRLIAGAAAERYLDDPTHVALTSVTGKLGDAGPFVVHGMEFSIEAVVAALLRGVVADVQADLGEPPAGVTICHPADWGTFTTNLLSWAVTLADLRPSHGVQLITVPEAVAVEASRHIDIPEGALFGVHDFGGRSFTAAVMRRTPDGFDTLGAPVRLPDLGGHDLDEALMQHVIIASGLGRAARSIPERGLAVLREACRRARAHLLTDVATQVAVALPGDATATMVPVTRAELDALIRPMLVATLDALRRSAASAGVSVEDFEMVLMIGGVTDLPAMAAAVWDDLRIPAVMLDQPELAAARGAAWVCGGLATAGGPAARMGGAGAVPSGPPVPADGLGPSAEGPPDQPAPGWEPLDTAVHPTPVDPVADDLGPGDLARGDVGPGDVGPGDVGPGDVGPGDVGPGDFVIGDAPGPAVVDPVDDVVDWSDEPPADTDPPVSRRRVTAALLAVAAGIAVLGGLGAAAVLVGRDEPVAAGTCPAAAADGPWVCVTSAAVTDGRLRLSLTTYLATPPSVVAAPAPRAAASQGAGVRLFGSDTAEPSGAPQSVIDIDELAAELSLDYNLLAEPRAARIADRPFVCAEVIDASGAPLVRDEPTVDCAAIIDAGDVDITGPPAPGLTPPPVTTGTTSVPLDSVSGGSSPAATPGGPTRDRGTARTTSATQRPPSAPRPPSASRSSSSTESGGPTAPPLPTDPGPPPPPPPPEPSTPPTTPPVPTITTTTPPSTTVTEATTEPATTTTPPA